MRSVCGREGFVVDLHGHLHGVVGERDPVVGVVGRHGDIEVGGDKAVVAEGEVRDHGILDGKLELPRADGEPDGRNPEHDEEDYGEQD